MGKTNIDLEGYDEDVESCMFCGDVSMLVYL
jgi:hypothetical protein